MKSSKSQSNEKILLFGHLTSKLGDIIFDYANKIVLVSAFTSKPWVLALYQSMEYIVGIIFNIIGGLLADFGNKKKIIILLPDIYKIIKSLSFQICLALLSAL